jgi:sulfur carrier protein ThiS
MPAEEIELTVVVLRRGSRTLKLPKGAKVEDAIKALGLNPVEYVAVLNGRIVPDDEPIEIGTTLKLIPVVSGG